MSTNNLLLIFLTGLTTGGLTCLALQGGLLASVLSNNSNPKDNQKTNYDPIFAFLTAKLISHTLLGFLLGVIGSTISLSSPVRGWLQIGIGFYLFGIAANLLDLHPIFRYFVITPPKFALKLAKKTSRSTFGDNLTAAFLGLLTVFIPCATTQAMAILALGSGNAIYSALIMFAFILGTFPSFLIFGFLVEKGSVTFQKYFPKIAATAMFIMSVYAINSGVAVMGSIYTIQNFYAVATQNNSTSTDKSQPIKITNNTQEVTINVNNSGYTPRNIALKKGIPVKLKLITNKVYSCSRSFTIPALNINKLLPETGETIIEFTPSKNGPLVFACSMGMYTGNFNVIN